MAEQNPQQQNPQPQQGAQAQNPQQKAPEQQGPGQQGPGQPASKLEEKARQLTRDAAKGDFLKSVKGETDQLVASFATLSDDYRQRHPDLLATWQAQDKEATELRDAILRAYPNDEWRKLLGRTACMVHSDIASAAEKLDKAHVKVSKSERDIAAAEQKLAATKERFASWTKPVDALTKALQANDTELKRIRALLTKDGKERIPVLYRFWFHFLPKHYAIALDWGSYGEPVKAVCDGTRPPAPPGTPEERSVYLVAPAELEREVDAAMADYRRDGERLADLRADAALDKAELEAARKRLDELRKGEEATATRMLQDTIECRPKAAA